MSTSAIHVEGLSKRYRLGAVQERFPTLRDALANSVKAPFRAIKRIAKGGRNDDQRTMWALRDLSFDVAQGTVLGVIGRNGAGKSTLLKVLSRITEPTEGRAVIRGRVGSLLEVGTGFHPELTGRENILLNGAILGMRRADILRKFDAIVAFAEVEKFIDTVVKHYSSGMYLRLAFAVAAHLEPQILLVDEVLAVGDQAFQQKCLGKMGEVASDGRTVLFVSHNMAAVRALCTEAMLLRDGKLAMRGAPADVINQYLLRDEAATADLRTSTQREGDGAVMFTSIKVLDHIGQATDAVFGGEKMAIEMSYESKKSLGELSGALVFHLFFTNTYGERLFTCSTRFVAGVPDVLPSSGTLRCVIDRLPLAPGQYTLDVMIKAREVLADHVWGVKRINVGEGDFWGTGKTPRPTSGPFMVDHRFEVAG